MKPASNHLLLVSYEYPFGKGETFLENELPVLSAEFSSITILPARACYSPSWFKKIDKQHRPLPANCSLLLPDSANRFPLSRKVFCYLLSCADCTSIPLRPGMLYKTRELFRETLKTARLTPLLVNFLQTTHSPITAYSYWKGPAAAALCFAKKHGLLSQCATRCHGGDLYYEILPFPYRAFDRYIAENCDLVLPVSQKGVDYLAQRGFSKKQLKLSRLGIKKQAEQSPVSDDGILRIVSCANLIPVKRITLLCRVLSHFPHPFQWVHFGDGFERPLIEEAVQSFPEHGAAQLYGRIANHYVLKYYRENPVDVFVNVSSSEGVPVSIMEALMAGIPCIATNVGGTSEIVDSACGHLLPGAVTEQGLTSVLNAVVHNNQEWRQKRQAAFSRATQRCDAAKNYKNFAQLLKGVSHAYQA